MEYTKEEIQLLDDMMPHRKEWDVKDYDKKAGTYTLFAERVFKTHAYTVFQKMLEKSDHDPAVFQAELCEFDPEKYAYFFKTEAAEMGEVKPNDYVKAKMKEKMQQAQKLLYEEPFMKLPLHMNVDLFKFIVIFRMQVGK